MRKFFLIYTIVVTIVITGCKKGPGEGGNSSIIGYVHATDYDEKTALLLRTKGAEDMDVYIIYGNESSYGNKMKTGMDGKFEFKYLRKGSYKIYTYSVVLPISKTSAREAVIKSIEITAKKKTIDAGTFEINRKF